MADALNQAVDMATKSIQKVLDTVNVSTSGAGSRKLSKQEQVERFFRMTEGQLSALKAAKGEEEFNRYMSAMSRLAGSRF